MDELKPIKLQSMDSADLHHADASYREPCGGSGNVKIPYNVRMKCCVCGAKLNRALKCTYCDTQHTIQIYGGGSSGTAK